MGVVRKVVNYLCDTLTPKVDGAIDHLPARFNGTFNDNSRVLTMTIESQGTSTENLTAEVTIPGGGGGGPTYSAGNGITITPENAIEIDPDVTATKASVDDLKNSVGDCFNDVTYNSETNKITFTALDGQSNVITLTGGDSLSGLVNIINPIIYVGALSSNYIDTRSPKQYNRYEISPSDIKPIWSKDLSKYSIIPYKETAVDTSNIDKYIRNDENTKAYFKALIKERLQPLKDSLANKGIILSTVYLMAGTFFHYNAEYSYVMSNYRTGSDIYTMSYNYETDAIYIETGYGIGVIENFGLFISDLVIK